MKNQMLLDITKRENFQYVPYVQQKCTEKALAECKFEYETPLKFFWGSAGIGDLLMVTPVFKKLTDCKIQALDSPVCRDTFELLKGLCEVEFVSEPTYKNLPNNPWAVQGGQAILDLLKIADVNCVPKINVYEEELNTARELLSKYKNPIVFCPNKNTDTLSPAQPRYELFDNEKWKEILVELKNKGYDVLQFAKDNNYVEFGGVELILDKPLRIVAACFQLIGNYVGIEGGLAHLMLAAGGFINVLLPDTNVNKYYLNYQWIYPASEVFWKDESPRANYYWFDEHKEIINYV